MEMRLFNLFNLPRIVMVYFPVSQVILCNYFFCLGLVLFLMKIKIANFNRRQVFIYIRLHRFIKFIGLFGVRFLCLDVFWVQVSLFFETFPYRLNEATGQIDYDKMEENAALFRPKVWRTATEARTAECHVFRK